MKKNIFYFLLFVTVFMGNSCKPECQESPDWSFFLLFNIVDHNGHSLLVNAYPINNVVIYDIEDSTKTVESWKRPGDPSIGIRYFDAKKDSLGDSHRKYGIKLNSTDTDTLEMLFTVGPIKKCEYQCSPIVMYYNKKECIKENGLYKCVKY